MSSEQEIQGDREETSSPESGPAPVPSPSSSPSSMPPQAPEADARQEQNERKENDAKGEQDAKDELHNDANDANDATSSADDDEVELLAKGNPLRLARGGITAAIGSVIAFLLMAHNGQLRLGVPLGFVAIAIASWGLMDLLGTFDDAEERVAHTTTLSALTRPLVQVGAMGLLFGLALMGGQSGLSKQWLWGILVTAAFIALVASIFELGRQLGPWRTDELGAERPLLQRHGFWLMVAAAGLYLPFLGSFSLWDPWETHYGEVAREILARDDWISLWWASDGWFWSKPVLNFWIQSLAMATLGTHYQPGEMLMGPAGQALAHPEWVVRTPNFLMTAVAMYLIYKGVAKVFGRRAGLLGGLVLATMPDWYFLAHQTMTDMPFVAAMTAAMGLLLIGLHTSDEDILRAYEIKAGKLAFRVTGWHLVFGIILATVVPQILYLLSRNLELVLHGDGPHGFLAHLDQFRSGSGGGNCGMPGNEACNLTNPASIPKSVGPHPEGFVPSLVRFFGGFEPSLQGLLWSVITGALLYINWGERRTKRMYYLAAWYCAALATMAKGPAGFALPVICALAYVCTKKHWGEFLKLEILSGLLIIALVTLPWWVAMYVRHGSPFIDQLFFHHMFNRTFHHVHDTNEGDDTSFRFYVWQLGYALFPWTGLAPLGLLWWLRRSDSADRGKGDASVFLVMWFIFTFALFSFMGTKFHHYIFPAVPPVAMLIGIALRDMMGDAKVAPKTNRAAYFLPLAGLVIVLVVAVTQAFKGSLSGGTSTGINVAALVLGLALTAVWVVRGLLPKPAEDAPRERASEPAAPAEVSRETDEGEAKDDASSEPARAHRTEHEALMLSAAAFAAALVTGLVARDLAIKETTDQPGAIRLLQLFTYNYRRPWPDDIDFTAVLTSFGIVAAALALLLSVRAIRQHAVMAFTAFAVVWAVWGLDVYMVETAPHWGQHEVIQAYYDNRGSAEEPLVAYQMNWKGENFYTSNKVPAFISSGSTFTTWIRQQRDKGVRVMYFVTEHSRTGGLKSEVGARAYREVTDKHLCNKFVLVRAEF
ncbi:glycosyltransferase family 39 protein [Pendulispora albinea]|uniref:Glycosyltransferase family 39 protein n=1 Tax=Pendulispora albinea TaxID=2741071 RepID=A0ABZ2LSH8_9BACT